VFSNLGQGFHVHNFNGKSNGAKECAARGLCIEFGKSLIIFFLFWRGSVTHYVKLVSHGRARTNDKRRILGFKCQIFVE
jgi:hypothetical protein